MLFGNISSAKKPKSNEDLWNLKLLFDSQEFFRNENLSELNEDENSNIKLNEMKTLLWKWKSSRLSQSKLK